SFEELDAQTAHWKEDIVISTGVEQHRITMVTSGGLGQNTMLTYYLSRLRNPAAIGAKVAAAMDVDIDGDASFSMTAMYVIGVKGTVVQWQDLFYEARYLHTTMVNLDFVLLAKSMGVHPIKCSNAEELLARMKEFPEYGGAKPIII
ncbi:hypothetical protein BD779DRAFT_1567457, partial [Infundibulicybe gibba]